MDGLWDEGWAVVWMRGIAAMGEGRLRLELDESGKGPQQAKAVGQPKESAPEPVDPE